MVLQQVGTMFRKDKKDDAQVVGSESEPDK